MAKKRKVKVKTPMDLQSWDYKIQEIKILIKAKKEYLASVQLEHAGLVAEHQRMLVQKALDNNGIKRMED